MERVLYTIAIACAVQQVATDTLESPILGDVASAVIPPSNQELSQTSLASSVMELDSTVAPSTSNMYTSNTLRTNTDVENMSTPNTYTRDTISSEADIDSTKAPETFRSDTTSTDSSSSMNTSEAEGHITSTHAELSSTMATKRVMSSIVQLNTTAEAETTPLTTTSEPKTVHHPHELRSAYCDRCLLWYALPQGCQLKKSELHCVRSGDSDILNKVAQWIEVIMTHSSGLPGCVIEELPSMCPISSMDFRGGNIRSIERNSFNPAILPMLLQLNFADNEIVFVDNSAFTGLQNLEYIDLRGNQITKLGHDAFTGLPRLNLLHLQDNTIKCRAKHYSNHSGRDTKCYGCMDVAGNSLLMLSTDSYLRCERVTHIQVLALVLILELLFFYTCHTTCMRPDGIGNKCDIYSDDVFLISYDSERAFVILNDEKVLVDQTHTYPIGESKR